jgi:hypothetical protein
MTRWEYKERMVMLNEVGADGWELGASVPLIAPNRDGVAYGTLGALLIFKRPIE